MVAWTTTCVDVEDVWMSTTTRKTSANIKNGQKYGVHKGVTRTPVNAIGGRGRPDKAEDDLKQTNHWT